MNQRIQQLALESGAWHQVYDQKRFMVDSNFDVERFAELIVQRCRDIVSANRDLAIEDGWNVDEAMSTAMFDIEEHFGVEE